MGNSRLRALGAALTAGVLVLSACGGSEGVDDAIEEVGDSVEEVSDNIEESADEANESVADLADSLRDNGLESLASAVEEVDFTELTGSDEFTFFAPDDDAFQSLEADQIADLLADPGQLDDVLRRHVVDEALDAGELVDMTSVETEGGTTLDITVDGDTIMVGDATIGEADIEVSDGVVHVVDRIFVDA
jgi:uncharacterized surface protein with fasciclin (FAS1) repeats